MFPSASGWVARLGLSERHSSGLANPYAAGSAAAFAAAELFRRIFLKSSAENNVAVSLLNFDASTGSDLDVSSSSVGEVLFVAVGAVGNAAIWSLARDRGRSGHLVLIDSEQLELSNLQRYILGSLRDVLKTEGSSSSRGSEGQPDFGRHDHIHSRIVCRE